MTSKALKEAATGQPQNPAMDFPEMLHTYKNQIAAALPRHIDPARMIRIALSCFRATPTVAECDPASIFACVVQSAQLGLEPGINGEAYLVPFWNNKKKRLECQLIPGYRGLIKLARNTAGIMNVSAQIVYSNDKASLTLGTEESLIHEPYLSGARGHPEWAYCVAHFKDGGHHIEAMTWDEIQKIKERSKSRNAKGELVGPWVTDENEMSRKTVVRRGSKYWPMSIELATAVGLDIAAERGVAQELNTERILEGDAYVVPNDKAKEPPQDSASSLPGVGGEKAEAPAKPPPSAPESEPAQVDNQADNGDSRKVEEGRGTGVYSVEYLLEMLNDAVTQADLDYIKDLCEKHLQRAAKTTVFKRIEAKAAKLGAPKGSTND